MFMPLFYTDYGRDIKIGKRVVIQRDCMFMDREGIVIEDDVKIAACVNLITLNHLLDPADRSTTTAHTPL